MADTPLQHKSALTEFSIAIYIKIKSGYKGSLTEATSMKLERHHSQHELCEWAMFTLLSCLYVTFDSSIHFDFVVLTFVGEVILLSSSFSNKMIALVHVTCLLSGFHHRDYPFSLPVLPTPPLSLLLIEEGCFLCVYIFPLEFPLL